MSNSQHVLKPTRWRRRMRDAGIRGVACCRWERPGGTVEPRVREGTVEATVRGSLRLGLGMVLGVSCALAVAGCVSSAASPPARVSQAVHEQKTSRRSPSPQVTTTPATKPSESTNYPLAPRTRTGCFSGPGACGYPDPKYGNVGAAHCSEMQTTGSMILSSAGRVIANLNIIGKVYITAPDVTLKNVCVTYDGAGALGSTAVQITASATNVRIEDSSIGGANQSNRSMEIAASNWGAAAATLTNDYLYNCGECVHSGPWYVDDSYIISNGMRGTSDHYEDVYCNDSTVDMHHDTLLNPYGYVAEVFCDTNGGDGGACTNNVSIDNSLLAGGGFVLYACGNASSVGTSRMSLTRNRFARCKTLPVKQTPNGGYDCAGSMGEISYAGNDSHGYWPYGGHYGVASATYCPPSDGHVWSDNFWDDDGSSVTCQG